MRLVLPPKLPQLAGALAMTAQLAATSFAGETARWRVESEEQLARLSGELARSAATAVEVTIAAGHYQVTDSIRINRSRVTLSGEGDVEIVLAAESDCPVIAIGTQASYVEEQHRIEDVTIRSISIDGNRLSQKSEYDRRYPWIRNNGIDVRGVKGLVIDDARIRGCRSGGLVISWGCSGTLVYRSVFEDNHFDGIAYYDSSSVFTVDCVSRRNLCAGISLDNRLADTVFARCRVEDNGDVGVFARNSSRLYFVDCQIKGSREWAFFLAHDEMERGVVDSAIVDCAIVGNGGGVRMASTRPEQSRNNTLYGNRFDANQESGRSDVDTCGAPIAQIGAYDVGERIRDVDPRSVTVARILASAGLGVL